MKGLIIFCHPAINYLVSTDVISQYLFFKRAKKNIYSYFQKYYTFFK